MLVGTTYSNVTADCLTQNFRTQETVGAGDQEKIAHSSTHLRHCTKPMEQIDVLADHKPG